MPAPYLAAIFDMDGLLFDTESVGRWAWGQALSRFGKTLDDALYQRFVGRDMRARLALLRERFGVDFPAEEAAACRLAVGDEREIREGVPAKAGALALVRALHQRGVPLALATGTERERALRRLGQAGIQDCFTVVVTSQDVAHGKPAPDIVLEAARRLGVAPERTVMFEDSTAGVAAALAAGADVVAVPDLEPLEPELLARCQHLTSLELARERLEQWFGPVTA